MFNINEFKSRLDDFGGPSRTGLFVAEFYGSNPDGSRINDESLRFFCKSITMPGINFSVMDYSPRNFGMPESVPVGFGATALNALFIMDSDHQIMTFFHEWAQNVGNYNALDGFYQGNPRSNNQLAYEFNYKEDYALSMIIRHFSTGPDSIGYMNSYECVLNGVYPTEISPVNLSWETASDPATLSVNLTYSKFKFTGTQSGVNSPRGNSIIDYYTDLGDVSYSDQASIDNGTIIRPFSVLHAI